MGAVGDRTDWWGPAHYSAISGLRAAIPIQIASDMVREPAYWYNTHKQVDNDVVHAKLVHAGGAANYFADCVVTNPDNKYYGWGLYGYDICSRSKKRPLGQLTNGWSDVWFCLRDITIGGKVDVDYASNHSDYVAARFTFYLEAIEAAGKYRLRAHLGKIEYGWISSQQRWDVRFLPYEGADFAGLLAGYCGPIVDPRYLLSFPDGTARFLLVEEIWGKICNGLSRTNMFRSLWSWKSVSTLNLVSFTEDEFAVHTEELPRSAFLFHEPEQIQEHLDPVLLGQSSTNYWKNWLIQHAFLDACEHIPRVNDNSISNILEISAFIYSLVVKHQIEIPKSLSSLWLAYRYQYTTSSLDVRQAISFVKRHLDLGGLDRGITCYGQSYHNIDGTDVVCRCELEVSPREVGYLAKIWRALYTYGLQPNFYVIWDSIPYSFIVDWFLPLGDVAGALDASRMYTSEYYTFKRIIYSLTYIRRVGESKVHCYARWKGSSPPKLNGMYWFDPEADPSTKTRVFRALDAVSLCIGRH
jgi:hypothetical protein